MVVLTAAHLHPSLHSRIGEFHFGFALQNPQFTSSCLETWFSQYIVSVNQAQMLEMQLALLLQMYYAIYPAILAPQDRLHWCLYRRMGGSSLAAANLAHCWPLLVTILTQYSSNDRITEKTGRAIKQALQTSRKASAGLLPQVLEVVARQFHLTGHPCMLYIASELLKTFGCDSQYQAALGNMLAPHA